MARHISNLNIESFRGIRNLELNDLSNVNILVGANNCGKTSVLEAAMVLSRPNDFSNIVSISRLREGNRTNTRFSTSFYDSFLYLFNKLNDELEISVSGEVNNEKTVMRLKGKIEKMLFDPNELISKIIGIGLYPEWKNSINGEIDNFVGELYYEVEEPFSDGADRLSLFSDTIPVSFNMYDRVRMEQKPPRINMSFISTIDHIVKNNFDEIVRSKQLNNSIIEILNLFDSNIKDLRIVPDEDGRIIQMVDHLLLGYMPLSTYGDGIKKIIALANGVVEDQNGVLLVDEIETSIHANALKQVFNWLINACKAFNVQLFLTTHSIETVDAMLNCNPEFITDDLIRVITLSKKENQTIARILTGEKALQVRDDYDLELRK